MKKERRITMQIKNHEDKSGFTIIEGERKTNVNVENFYNAIKLDDTYISVVSDAEGYTRKCFDKEGRDVFMADSAYILNMAQNDYKHIKFHFTSEF